MANGPYYSPEEDAILKRIYPTQGARACLSFLPSRTLASLRCRAIHILHLKLSPGVKSELMKEVNKRTASTRKKRRKPRPPALDVINQWGRKR